MKNEIPDGTYCYDNKGYCPHWREDETIKSDFYGFGHQPTVWCDFLNINSGKLLFDGVYEENTDKCWKAHLLNDMCKICE